MVGRLKPLQVRHRLTFLGYPSGEAAEVAVGEVRRFLEELEEEEGKEGRLERVVFCVFEEKDERAYGEWLPYVHIPSY